MEWEGEAPAELVAAYGSAGAAPAHLDVPLTAQDAMNIPTAGGSVSSRDADRESSR